MFSSPMIIAVILLYMGLLFAIAMWAEQKKFSQRAGAIVYALSLAVYCTTWTFYGSVGKAASSGLIFLTIYLGPTLAILLWWSVLRKLVRIKNVKKINSIADFIAARYNNSQLLAALATIMAVLGVAPYIALQLKAVVVTFTLITREPENSSLAWLASNIGPAAVLLMILFTIIFGVRRLDPTERHQGMVTAVAFESIVKLLAFIAGGVFVTYIMFDGLGDIVNRAALQQDELQLALMMDRPFSYATWFTYLLLGMSAIIFLPRQFHIAVVENSNENHILTSQWLFPLYMLLINLFVVPIAIGGSLKGLPLAEADSYVIALPLLAGSKTIALLVFIGGFSAATSMIMISAMTTSTMITNHLVLPLLELSPKLASLQRHLLHLRWLTVVFVILLGYWFERKLGVSYTLVNMGMISFAAAMLFAPPIIGGIYWKRGNQRGALLGMSTGLFFWFYTLLMPSFVKSGWLAESLLTEGPFGLSLLRPEELLGMSGLDPLTHGVFWAMFFNVGLYIVGSLAHDESYEEKKIAETFVNLSSEDKASYKAGRTGGIIAAEKTAIIQKLLGRYLSPAESGRIIDQCLLYCGLREKRMIDIVELSRLCSQVEKHLAGSVGAIAAHKTFALDSAIYSPEEARELADQYKKILADMDLTPDELREKIDFHQEREKLISAHAGLLESKIRELEENIRKREEAERALQESKKLYTDLVEESPDAIISLSTKGRFLSFNPAAAKVSGYKTEEVLGRHFSELAVLTKSSSINVQKEFRLLVKEGERPPVEYEIRRKDGSVVTLEANARLIKNKKEKPWIQVVLRDITERKRIETELKFLQSYLDNIINSMPSILVGVDTDFKVTLWNHEAEKATGLSAEQAGEQKLFEAFSIFKGESQRLERAFASRQVQKGKVGIEDLAGKGERIFEVTVYPLTANGVIGAVLRLDDITERVRIEEMMIQNEKMMSVGGLAAGMAHEINNPLAGIAQSVQVFQNRLSLGMRKNIEVAEKCGVSLEDVRSYLEKRELLPMLDGITESVVRASKIVANMLSFSRGSSSERLPCDIADLLDQTIELAGSDYSLSKSYDFREIEIVREYGENLPEILCEESKIRQVFLNVLTNGAHAMFSHQPSSIRPRLLFRITLEEPYVRVEIEDNGPGMEEAVRRRIFEPFFTTKTVGEGTGLGLSVSYFIVTEHHGGNMSVESSPGEGARFVIELPIQ